ncbi:hypothetical protein [Streptomyces sp. NBC_01089]|uniref:hypothetical protein n=1 Tax=Streptomyces sp. NBC_01089 TaxID=2903747 RepID=UPI0038633B73|nr:hypothetical protein OG510_00330 [Streptomyces sp. NBC_01089]WSU46372.1 hypothetical protein OG510_36820 [Streptomyces sp. NBC_01089]
MYKPCRVLLLTPDAGLIRAVSDTGLEPWALRRTGAGAPGGIPPERTLTTDDPARTLRDLAADEDAGHGIDFVVSGGDTEPAVLDALRGLALGPGRTGPWLPDRAELREILGWGPVPGPAPAGVEPAPVCQVDTVSVSGMHLLLGIAWPESRQPMGESEQAGVRETVRCLLDLIGHQFGGTRTDVALTPTGPDPVGIAGTSVLVSSLGPGTKR